MYLGRMFTKDGKMKGEMLQHANIGRKTVIYYKELMLIEKVKTA